MKKLKLLRQAHFKSIKFKTQLKQIWLLYKFGYYINTRLETKIFQ